VTTKAYIMLSALFLAVSAASEEVTMTLVTEFDATRLYVDQPVTMTVSWSSSVSFARCWELQMEQPILHLSDWEIYPIMPDVPEKQRIGLPVGGQRIIAARMTQAAPDNLRFSYVLIPRRPGRIRPTPARLQCALMQDNRPASPYPSYFDNHFFRSPDANDHFDRIHLTSPVPALTIRRLPADGRTPRYCGIVGAASVTSTIEPVSTTVGQPMLLTVTLTDVPFTDSIKAIPAVCLDDLGPEFLISREPLRTTSGKHSKSFTYIVRPLRSGIDTVPGLALQVFDPTQHDYRTIRTRPLTISIKPDGTQTVYQPHTANVPEPHHPLPGIRGNRNESETIMRTYQWIEFMADHAMALWLIPPLLWLMLRPWLRRRDRCRTDPAYARAIRAARRFHRTCSQNEETAWRVYLADRFGLTAEAVTFESVSGILANQHVSADLIDAVRDRFTHQDAKDYAPARIPRSQAPSAVTLVKRIEKSVRLLLLAVCLLPALTGWGATPEERFEQAMQMRAERPDEARPLFTEAALEFEACGLFFNAGNSWFFAGKPGRSLASYRAAERLRPFNSQLRESIAFIRTQRADTFPSGAHEQSRIIQAWNQFAGWCPAMHGAFLTIIYVTAWILFLTARFIGRTVPHLVWMVLVTLSLPPSCALLQSCVATDQGVVIEAVDARLGPSYAYDKAYEMPLHEATEFQWLAVHKGWVRARLPDGNEAWLRETACVKVR